MNRKPEDKVARGMARNRLHWIFVMFHRLSEYLTVYVVAGVGSCVSGGGPAADPLRRCSLKSEVPRSLVLSSVRLHATVRASRLNPDPWSPASNEACKRHPDLVLVPFSSLVTPHRLLPSTSFTRSRNGPRQSITEAAQNLKRLVFILETLVTGSAPGESLTTSPRP